MVSPVEVGDHEGDELCVEVAWRSELNGQRYLAMGYSTLTQQDAPELSVIRFLLCRS